MKKIICFLVKAIIAFSFGIFAASFSEEISRYHYADVCLFFSFGIIAFYFLDGVTKKIARL